MRTHEILLHPIETSVRVCVDMCVCMCANLNLQRTLWALIYPLLSDIQF